MINANIIFKIKQNELPEISRRLYKKIFEISCGNSFIWNKDGYLIRINKKKDTLFLKIIKDEKKKSTPIQKLVYNLNENNILFGKKFIKNNKNKWKLIISNKKKCIIETEEKKEKLYTKLIFLDNIIDFNSMFCGCSSLIEIKAKVRINNISGLFYRCSSLKTIPDISKWNKKNLRIYQDYFIDVLH